MGARGYLCIPHDKESGSLLENWKKSDNILDIYFVTATFSDESTPYFPNKANHYILASFIDVTGIVDDIENHKMDRLSLIFSFPYSRNLLILEVEGKKTHQTDQKYCERTRRDVARMGISLNNLVSFSVLEKLK